MMKTSSAFVFASLLTAYCSLSQAEVTGTCVEVVEASLKEGNPRATLEKYFSCEKYEGSAYEGIASGSTKWISLAERMLQYSDACYTEGIQASLGKAMQRSPKNVLSLVDKTSTLAASYICLPFISSELPIKLQLTEVIRSRKAIQNVHDDRLQTQKAACIHFIKSVEVNLIAQQSSTSQESNVPSKGTPPDKPLGVH